METILKRAKGSPTKKKHEKEKPVGRKKKKKERGLPPGLRTVKKRKKSKDLQIGAVGS